MERDLLTLKEFCVYTGLGMTKAREIVKENNTFSVQIGNKWYISKSRFDNHIDRCIKYQISI
jgi:excisionase family DNA binding protein